MTANTPRVQQVLIQKGSDLVATTAVLESEYVTIVQGFEAALKAAESRARVAEKRLEACKNQQKGGAMSEDLTKSCGIRDECQALYQTTKALREDLNRHKELLRQAVNRCADMKEALEFYGDVKNYAVWTSGPLGEENDSFEFDDGGKRARAVLSKHSKGGRDE